MVEVPNFIGFDTVKGRELSVFEQEVDRRRSAPLHAVDIDAAVGTVSLTEVSAFRVGLQAEAVDPISGVHCRHAGRFAMHDVKSCACRIDSIIKCYNGGEGIFAGVPQYIATFHKEGFIHG